MHVRLWKIAWQGYERIFHAEERFWQVLNVEEREKTDLKSQSIFQACVKLNFSFMLFSFLAS